MAVPETIQPLVDKYTFHRDAYIRGQEKYNEAQLRQDFTDPFFHALGWDVNNNKGHSEAYREVMHGEPIRIRGTTQFFDYTFRIGGVRKFIVETKKPSMRIKDDADAALQLRRYAWNAKLPLSILTNFEEWAIYNCTIKPEHADAAAKGRIEYFTYKEIPEKWEYLVSVFSQDSILKGLFDKYAASTKGKKGTATVDDDFLTEIESWRAALAKNIALRNEISEEVLNIVVQRTIDRIIFLRICEDRGIEEYTTLHKLLEGDHVYTRLCELFRQADAKYNSGLFHFEKETNWDEMPDTISLSLVVDDKVVKGIIKRLYYPETPYLFSVIPPEILGHVYEQFLGKVITLKDGHHKANVIDKPEVKKAGGVFYTPQYIVEYIVKHTVGELTKDKTPRGVAKLRILDPACGSGSFLIGAYQFLLDWHRDWYIENLVPVFIDKKSVADPAVLALLPEATPRGKKHLAQAELPIYKAGTSGDITRTRSDWRLTTVEKKRILLNNIFGVDIDQQAVEVTKLSLLLKVLEEENEENIDKQLKLFAERALPSLHQNIKCGNSLIGTDILTPEMPSDEVNRINPFDWDREFADAMKVGGFDAVIGNPPYVLLQNLNQPIVFEYMSAKFAAAKYKIDTYQVFIEQGILLTKKSGRFGYITPNSFLRNKHAVYLRRFILANANVEQLRIFCYPVFSGASVDTSIIIVSKTDRPNLDHSIKIVRSHTPNEPIDPQIQSQRIWVEHPTQQFSLSSSEGAEELITKIGNKSFLLGEIATAYFGIQTFDRKVFVKPKKEAPHFKPIVDGGNILRYTLLSSQEYVDFRPVAIKSGGKQIVYEQDRIGVRQIGREPIATILPAGTYTLNTIYNVFFTKPTQYNLLFILGLACSKTHGWYWRQSFFDQKETFPKVKKDALLAIPIRIVDFANPADKACHDRMVALVTQMLDLNKRLQDATLDHEKTLLNRQVEAADAAIDKLVYELYGLTAEEIAIINGTTASHNPDKG